MRIALAVLVLCAVARSDEGAAGIAAVVYDGDRVVTRDLMGQLTSHHCSRVDGWRGLAAADGIVVAFCDGAMRAWRAEHELWAARGAWLVALGGGRAVVGDGRRWTVRDAATGRIQRRFLATSRRVALTRDGKWLALVSDDGYVTVSDAATGKRRWRSVVAVGMVAALVFSPGGTELAVGGLGPNFVVVDNTTGRERWRAQHEQGLTLSALVWSPWGDELASAGGDVAIWDAMHGRLVERFLIAGGDALSLAYADDGNRLAVGAADGTVSQFNTDGYTPIP